MKLVNNYANIVVAVDGSEEANYAFRKSIDIAKRNQGSTLNIVNIVDSRALPAYQLPIIEQVRKDSEKLLYGYRAQALAEGIENVKTIVELGSPKRAITNVVSEQVKADLIVCGAHGVSGVERLLMGSVSEAIVRSATCDVLVVRTPA